MSEIAVTNADVPGEPVSAVRRPPYAFARQYGICVQSVSQNAAKVLYKGMIQPHILAEIRRFMNIKLDCEQVNVEDFERVVSLAYQHEAGATQKMMEDVGELLDVGNLADALEIGDLLEQQDDAPIIRLINVLIMEAIRENASDIHIETFEKRFTVRFRIDGVLSEVVQPPRQMAPLLVSRIKVMAKLDIAEKRLPQDGRISLRIGGREIDVRVSTMPATNGERVVLRLLDKQTGRLHLEQLGLCERDVQVLQGMIHKPHGIILVTGPTGSGKTTTLYAMLSKLNDRTSNILTIEDPIEYQIDGIGQMQVNIKIDLTFARGLRAILRQDPDVVMIGEIRDAETATIAVQASLTGHLVISTLHTNSAVGAVLRLQDMGIEPFLLSSSLVGLIAQRLVRRLCNRCRKTYYPDSAARRFLGLSLQQDPIVYRAVGCEECRGTGYRGRFGIYELIIIDEPMRTLIHSGANELALEAHARTLGPGITQDGRDKILQGLTTIEEIMRVTKD